MKGLFTTFKQYIQSRSIGIQPDDKILLAVSGGVDSVVMSALFHRTDYNFGIAHCNFGIRGKESDRDERFVKELSGKYGTVFYTRKFETTNYAKDNGISIQMAAREIRYKWFKKIRISEKYDFVAIAHHKNDEVETFLINLIRGTGIAGFHGIYPKQNNIIRPLLFASKEEILKYAKKENIAYIEDSSNQSLKYVRNKIRHKVIPLLKEINPDIDETIAQEIKRIREVELIYKEQINKKKKELIKEEGDKIIIPIDKLQVLNPLKSYLFEFLKEYNFGSSIVNDIILSLNGISGKLFFSSTHRLLKDRDKLIINKVNDVEDVEGKINKGETGINFPVELKIKIIEKDKTFKISEAATIACLDHDKLQFPLRIRKWKEGDVFFPLGMEKKKKLSDFFIDNKIPLTEKENIFVLESCGKIVWIIGHRIDNRFKISIDTKIVYFVELIMGD